MAAYAVDVGDESFSNLLTPRQRISLEGACRARGATLDWSRGLVTIPGRIVHALCADLPLPPGLHLTRAGLEAGRSAPGTVFRIEVLR
ncbi:MAG: hypothetical protein AAFP04_12380 [Myxococcota bacterium]